MTSSLAPWIDSSSWHDDVVSREAFYVPCGADQLFMSAYRPVADRSSVGVLACVGWGRESWRLSSAAHDIARRVTGLRATGVVLHWPGHEDSTGDPVAVTMDDLRDAVVSGVRGAEVHLNDVSIWLLVGIRLGGSAVALAAHDTNAARVLLIEPLLDPGAHLAAVRRAARRANLGRPMSSGWAFGHSLPPGLATIDAVTVTRALSAISGRCTAISYQDTAQTLPSDIEHFTVHGRWRAPEDDHSALVDQAMCWLATAIEAEM